MRAIKGFAAVGATAIGVGAGIMAGAVGGSLGFVLSGILTVPLPALAGLALALNLVSALTNLFIAPEGSRTWELKVFGWALAAGLTAVFLSLTMATAAFSFVAPAAGGGRMVIDLGLVISVAARGVVFWSGWLAMALFVTTRSETPRGGAGLTIWLALGAGVMGIAAGAGRFIQATVPMVPTSTVSTVLVALGAGLIIGGTLMVRFAGRVLWNPRTAPPHALLWAGLGGVAAGVLAVAGEVYFVVVPLDPGVAPGWAPDPVQVAQALELTLTTAPILVVAGALIAVAALHSRLSRATEAP